MKQEGLKARRVGSELGKVMSVLTLLDFKRFVEVFRSRHWHNHLG
jgi:hypothetical protein